MQLKFLAAILPFLLLASAAPAPQAGSDNRSDKKYTDSQKDGSFTLEIIGGEAYTGDVGNSFLSLFGKDGVVPTSLQVQRLKSEEDGDVLQSQVYQGFFSYKADKNTAVECTVTTRSTIPIGARVIWDITDMANPLATLEPALGPAFEEVHCSTTHD